MNARRESPMTTRSGVLLIPAALGVFTALTVILTIRVIGFAVLAGIGVFLAAFVLTMLLDALVVHAHDRDGRRGR